MERPTPDSSLALKQVADAEYRLSHPDRLVTTYEELVFTIAHLVQLISYYEGFSYREEGDRLTVFDQAILLLLRNQLQLFVDLRDNLGLTVQFTDQTQYD